MSLDSMLIHLCDIETLAQGAQGNYGTPAETFSDSYADQECRLMATPGYEVKVGAEVFISNWKLFLPVNITVDWQDRVNNIRLRSNSSVLDTSTFEILAVEGKNDSFSEHHKEVYLRKVD